MPFVNIRVTKENGTPTAEQKRLLIDGVTNLLTTVLGKNRSSTVVIIDEVDTDNYGLGGESITNLRKKQAE
ncbi:4-oxalocrotonate tautomerase family protein [Campylobacter sp. faydin G-24]|uniref:Tautomerase n=1 Tax=Campylobacter anatolicus TaxID=2829105 RepID=A0ABS5HJ97_9BACT|nr:4-oxalocrotonate tautomerase family protein [Campylobacter anatolicus]MBR8461934.1 4-oxalocrotonate tautomerase family protein [Campylobacter anatolicus]MBR8464331.1 4-oxalocrotonate tautomerase family protein [Campylobacter anatolicus]MBR8464976.1 4-oxalocrotonate tautomerase family protein [Campylobacter anatolicus]